MIVLLSVGGNKALSQSKPAYVLYNKKGKKVSYSSMRKKLRKANIILFGEYHNNPISHWLQGELARDLEKGSDLSIGAEMFERDNEVHLAQYLTGEVDHTEFQDRVRLWPNYKTDYKPLLDFAKEKGIPFVSTNIPKRFASIVYREGFEALEALSAEEKSWIAPLPNSL